MSGGARHEAYTDGCVCACVWVALGSVCSEGLGVCVCSVGVSMIVIWQCFEIFLFMYTDISAYEHSNLCWYKMCSCILEGDVKELFSPRLPVLYRVTWPQERECQWDAAGRLWWSVLSAGFTVWDRARLGEAIRLMSPKVPFAMS